ncbi:MAG: pyridoxal-dependent decarboxylase, partial [Bacteroidota bacterium]|nr:pyridoxal-dependent decarboxylase [Bacteroidota bacterium]MDX5430797.1 pyridoxal-dependent decarboxylase [Bacteroidota bacterium]MDX5469542.1 pyridoxal-dependent decarboxylase [Bacteroidota bacterium]
WKKLDQETIRKKVFSALEENVNFYTEAIVGVPASHLDSKVFFSDAGFLKDAPFLSSLIHNPNHIGCHTLGKSESFFSGTQQIERDLIAICAHDILKGEGEFDGYVASGGTEANMQAAWIYRNYFMREMGLRADEIALLASSDGHYSMAKACNVLGLNLYSVQVEDSTRALSAEAIEKVVAQLKAEGNKAVVVVVNMMTTMFGSVDQPAAYIEALNAAGLPFKMHVDGAYGGFFYPFSGEKNIPDFSIPEITSVTLDAHKMVQAPYGTGMFIIRKGWMQYAATKEASYVEGEDSTLIGSRSGANAVAIWMILSTYGPYAWREKIFVLQKRTDWLEDQLKNRGVQYFRQASSNIITIKAEHVPHELAAQFVLVPDNHHAPKWFKIVVMEHVTIERLMPVVEGLIA